MTVATEQAVEIGRSAEAVFAELVAVERYPEWLTASGVVAVERADGGPLVPGSRFLVTQRLAGTSARLEAVVTALEDGRRLAFRASEARGILLEVDATLDPAGLRCRLRWSVRISLPLRLRFFEGMVRPEVIRAAAADLENLRRRLDAVADGG